MKHLLFGLALSLASVANAESLNCHTQDFTHTTITINRDGSIGFDGTFVTIQSANGIFEGPERRHDLSHITKRESDKQLIVHGFTLPLRRQKSMCTPDTKSLESFDCKAQNIEIEVGAEEFNVVNDGSVVTTEQIKKEVRLKANVDLSFQINSNDGETTLVLKGIVTEPQSVHRIEIEKEALCKVIP